MNDKPRQILACQPADETVRAQIEKEMGQPMKRYSGSVRGVCELCGKDVWIGPRQQPIIVARDAAVICLICAASNIGLTQGEIVTIENLGNPQ